MSNVTNILITCMDEPLAIQHINRYMQMEQHGGLPFIEIPSNAIAGERCLESSLFAGAFNYLDTGKFLSAVAAAPWRSSAVQVFVKEQGDSEFTAYSLAGNPPQMEDVVESARAEERRSCEKLFMDLCDGMFSALGLAIRQRGKA